MIVPWLRARPPATPVRVQAPPLGAAWSGGREPICWGCQVAGFGPHACEGGLCYCQVFTACRRWAPIAPGFGVRALTPAA